MSKIIVSLILFFLGFHSQVGWAQTSKKNPEFIEAVEDFKASLKDQLQVVFLAALVHNLDVDTPSYLRLKNETERFVKVVGKGLTGLSADYQSQFIENNASPESKARFRYAEINLKWASEIALNSAAQILYDLKVQKQRGLSSRLKKFAMRLNEMSSQLEKGEAIPPRMQDEFYQRFPIEEGRLKALCSVAAGICQNKRIQNLLRGLSFDGLMRKGTQIDWSEASPLAIPANSAVVLIFNHDNTIADQKLMQIIAERLNIQNNLLTTTLRAWPHTNLLPFRNYFFNRESDSVFIEDPEMNRKVMDHLRQEGKGITSVSYFPEGDQAFWSAHFPLAAKSGGFVAARKAAIELQKQNRGVYLVQIQMNFWSQLTGQEEILKISVSSPQRVPTTPLSKNDEWVQQRRSEFETIINQERGLYQVDLVNPRQQQGVWQSGRTRLPRDCRKLLAQ